MYGRRRRIVSVLALGCIAALGCITASAHAAEPLWHRAPETGFIDDCLSFDASGSRLAYVHTDSATFLRVVVVATTSGQTVAQLQLDPSRIVPRTLSFTPDGKRLIVLFSDARRSTLGAALFALDDAKKLKELVGADHIAVVPHEGRQVLSLVSRRPEKSGRTRLSLALHDTLSLKRVARASLSVDANNGIEVGGKSMRLLYWGPGMTELVALEPGKYDAARDIRLPDLRVRYDLVKKQTIGAKRPENAVLARKALQMRKRHPAQRRLAHVSDDLKQLYLVRTDDTLRKLKTAHRWQLYEARSLRQHESWDGQVLYFSITVDPVNPEALARRKAAPERVDFYRVDSSGSLRLLGGTLVDKREFAWAASASHIAYLRKLRGFARGGKVLEVFATAD